MRPVTNPTARTLASWLCTLWGPHQAAWEGRLLPGCGAPGVGRSPSPDRSSFRACGRGPLPTGCGCGGCGRGDPSPTPQRALLRAGFARCRGGMWVPEGVPLAWVWGLRRGALSRPRPLVLSGVRPGPATHWLWVWGVQEWGPGTNPTARTLASCLCALWRPHEGALEGRLLSGYGASGVGCSPTPDHSSFRACGRGPLLTGRGCGVRAWRPGCPWHLVPCRGSSCVVRASQVRGIWWPLWLGTCLRAVVVAGGVPLWRASWPRVGAAPLVRSGRSRCSCRLSRRRGSFPHPGGCRPRLDWVAARGSWRPAENRAFCACRWPLPRQERWVRSTSYPFGAPQRNCPWRVPLASVLGCVRCGGLACVDPVTDASGFVYRPSFDGGLGRCTVTVSCGRRQSPFRVGGRHARVPRACVCLCVPCLAGSGGPASWARSGAPLLSCGWSWCALCLFGPLRAGVAPYVVVVGFFFCPSFPLLRPRRVLLCVFFGLRCLGPWRLVAPPPHCGPLSLALRVFRPRVPWALASFRPPPLFSPPPSLSPALPVFRGALGLCALSPPLLFFFSPLFPVFSLSICFFSFSFCWLCVAGRVCVSWAVGCARVCLGGAVPVVALCAPAGVVLCWLLCLAVFCCFPGLGVVLRWCCPCLAAWLAALWFGVVCLGVPLPCVVFCCAVLSCGGVLSCSAICLRCCLCLLFVSCRCASAVCVLGCGAVCSLSSPPCAVLCCAALVPFRCAARVVCAVSGGWCCGNWCPCLLLGVCWWLWLPGVVVWWCVSALVPVSGLAVARRLLCGVLLPCVVSCGAVLPCGAMLWSKKKSLPCLSWRA